MLKVKKFKYSYEVNMNIWLENNTDIKIKSIRHCATGEEGNIDTFIWYKERETKNDN